MPTTLNYDWTEIKRGDSDYPASHSSLVDEIDAEVSRIEQAFDSHDHSGGTLGSAANPVTEEHVESLHGGELSVSYNGTPAITEQAIYHYEDTDTTTAFVMDTTSLPEHDEYVVRGLLGGHGAGSYAPVQIQINGHTTGYTYRYNDNGTTGEVSDKSAWEDGMYDTRMFRGDWRISGASFAATSAGVSIRSLSSSEQNRISLMDGTATGAGGGPPVTAIKVFTDFNAVGRLVVVGVDY